MALIIGYANISTSSYSLRDLVDSHSLPSTIVALSEKNKIDDIFSSKELYEKVVADQAELNINGTNIGKENSLAFFNSLMLLNKWSVESSDQTTWQPLRTTEGLINQQSNVFENYMTMTFTPVITGKYRYRSNIVWSHNTTSDNFRAEVSLSGTGTSIVKRFLDVESTDSSGTGVGLNVIQGGVIVANVNTGTDAKHPACMEDIVELNAGVTYTMLTRFNAQSGNDEAAIYSGNQLVELIK